MLKAGDLVTITNINPHEWPLVDNDGEMMRAIGTVKKVVKVLYNTTYGIVCAHLDFGHTTYMFRESWIQPIAKDILSKEEYNRIKELNNEPL